MCKNNRQKAMNITTVESDVIPTTSRGSNDAIMINSDDECPNRDNECPICLTKIFNPSDGNHQFFIAQKGRNDPPP